MTNPADFLIDVITDSNSSECNTLSKNNNSSNSPEYDDDDDEYNDDYNVLHYDDKGNSISPHYIDTATLHLVNNSYTSSSKNSIDNSSNNYKWNDDYNVLHYDYEGSKCDHPWLSIRHKAMISTEHSQNLIYTIMLLSA